MSCRSKNRTFPRSTCHAIQAMQLVREMHSLLNVNRQPFRKRDKSRHTILSRRVSRRWHGRRYRRRCSGIKYPIESLIRQQTRPILGHLFAPTAMFALGVEARSVNWYFSTIRLCNVHQIRNLEKYERNRAEICVCEVPNCEIKLYNNKIYWYKMTIDL